MSDAPCYGSGAEYLKALRDADQFDVIAVDASQPSRVSFQRLSSAASPRRVAQSVPFGWYPKASERGSMRDYRKTRRSSLPNE